MADLTGNTVGEFERKDFHRNSDVPRVYIHFEDHVLASATAAASRIFKTIPNNGRILQIGIVPGILSSATNETGGLEFQVYLGASAAAAAALLSATARLDTGTTAGLITPDLITSVVDMHSGGIVVSAGNVLTIDVTEPSASHSVGRISGYVEMVWDK